MNTTVKNSIRAGIAFLFLSMLIATIHLRSWLNQQCTTLENQLPAQPQVWMTVWVHGSFATTLGLISVFNVIKDKVRKTNYKKMTRMMRKDQFFFQLQPLQELGLKPVIQSFNPDQSSIKHAAKLVSAAYELLAGYAHTTAEKNYFYTLE